MVAKAARKQKMSKITGASSSAQFSGSQIPAHVQDWVPRSFAGLKKHRLDRSQLSTAGLELSSGNQSHISYNNSAWENRNTMRKLTSIADESHGRKQTLILFIPHWATLQKWNRDTQT